MDSSFEVEESKDEAARALFDPSQVTLHALTSGLLPAAVRRRLVAHVAGAPPPEKDDPAMLSPLPGATPVEPTATEARVNRLRHVVDSGPIIAYIRKPRR